MEMKRFPALRLAIAKWQIHTVQAQIVCKGDHENTNTNSLCSKEFVKVSCVSVCLRASGKASPSVGLALATCSGSTHSLGLLLLLLLLLENTNTYKYKYKMITFQANYGFTFHTSYCYSM